jgi:hypothetical protein
MAVVALEAFGLIKVLVERQTAVSRLVVVSAVASPANA